MSRLPSRLLLLSVMVLMLPGCVTTALNWAASDKPTFAAEVESVRSKPTDAGEQRLCLRIRDGSEQESEWQKTTNDDSRTPLVLVLSEDTDSEQQVEINGWQPMACDESFAAPGAAVAPADVAQDSVEVEGWQMSLPHSVTEQVVAIERPVPCGDIERRLFYLRRDPDGIVHVYDISHAQRYVRPNRAWWLLTPVTVVTDILLSPIYAGIGIANAIRCDGDVWCDGEK